MKNRKSVPSEKPIFHVADKEKSDVMKIVPADGGIVVSVRDRSVFLEPEHIKNLKIALDRVID